MLDDETGRGGDRIVLARVRAAYFMLEGEAHLSTLLANGSGYPSPVHCIAFPSEFDLMRMLPDGQGIADLWSIHPDIVARLERNGELVTVNLPDDA